LAFDSGLPRRQFIVEPLACGRACLDQVSLLAAVEALAEQLRAADGSAAAATVADQAQRSLFVADGGLYSEAAMGRLTAADISWVSRVPATLTAAQTALQRSDAPWQTSADATSAPSP
jgi:transposase